MGWYSSGQRRESPIVGSTATIYTLRFAQADQSEAALTALSDRTVGENLSIPGYPMARGKYRTDDSLIAGASNTWLVHGDLLLHVAITDPLDLPVDPTTLADLTKRAFDKQIEMLKNYSPTPLDKISSLPLDVDGLLSRTIPLDKDELPVNGPDPSAVYPKQALLHAENYPDLAKAAYDDAGVDYVAEASSTIYRTKDASSTTRLIAAIESWFTKDYAKIDGPPNLPGARCMTPKPDGSSSIYNPVCWIAVDRYVAEVTGRNPQDLHQRTAAQYKLLAGAR